MKPNTWEFIRHDDGTYAVVHRGEIVSDSSSTDFAERSANISSRSSQTMARAHWFFEVQNDFLAFTPSIPAKLDKIHSPENRCKLSLRSNTPSSSDAKATAPKANATAKSFLILPLPATRKFSPTPPTLDRLSF